MYHVVMNQSCFKAHLSSYNSFTGNVLEKSYWWVNWFNSFNCNPLLPAYFVKFASCILPCKVLNYSQKYLSNTYVLLAAYTERKFQRYNINCTILITFWNLWFLNILEPQRVNNLKLNSIKTRRVGMLHLLFSVTNWKPPLHIIIRSTLNNNKMGGWLTFVLLRGYILRNL